MEQDKGETMKPTFLLGLKHFYCNVSDKIRKDSNLQGVAKPDPFPQKGQDEDCRQQLWVAGTEGEGSSLEGHSLEQ